MAGFRFWTEVSIDGRVVRWGTAVLAVSKEVPIEVDVVLIRAPKPGHSKRIQDMNQDQCGICGTGWKSAQELELDGGPGKAFDAMGAGGMKECFSRSIRTEPSDVDAESVA